MAGVRMAKRGFVVREWAVGTVAMPVADWLNIALLGARVPQPQHWLIRTGIGRYYADPMGFSLGGESFVAYEEFDPWLARGVIAVGVVRGGELHHIGRVIDEPGVHLAYPFIIEANGELFCVPDQSTDSLSVWKIRSATDWGPVGIMTGLPSLTDPTFVWKDDTWIALGVTRSHGEERFRVFNSPTLFGNWSECNPGGTPSEDKRRPAGPLVRVDDQWVRPSQDCSSTYGGALILNVVTSLKIGDFAEHPRVTIQAPPEWRHGSGIHTVSGTNRWTFIDAFRTETSVVALPQRVGARVARKLRVAHSRRKQSFGDDSRDL